MRNKLMYIGLAACVIFIKVFAYYNLMSVERHTLIFAAISTVTMIWLLFAFLRVRKAWAINVFLGIYTVVSFIMLVDAVYYKQFNMFTSVVLFKMMGNLGDVSASVKQILDIRFLIFMADIPAMIFITHMLKKREVHKVRISAILLAIMTVGVFSINFVPDSINFAENVKRIEFFNYHMGDVYKNLIQGSQMKYTEQELMNRDALRDKTGDQYNGVAKGRNLIVIQIESFQNFLMNREYEGQEITPVLNALAKENSFYFDRYYQQVGMGNTSDAEFITNNSLFGTLNGSSYEVYTRNMYKGLPWILRENGYNTISFHGYKGDFWKRNEAHPYQGFENFVSQEDFKEGEILGMGLSDVEVYKQSLGYLKEFKQPFYGFYISLSNHHPYVLPNKYRTIKLKPEHEGTLFGHYIQSAYYTDQALGEFIKMLKEEGLYDNSVIAMYGDHHGLVVSDEESKGFLTEYLGKEYRFDEMTHIPMMIHVPGLGEAKTLHIAGGQVDFAPTIMNLLGIKNTNPYMYGQDLLNAKEGFVPMLMYTGKGSFITNDVVFQMPKDGIFENAKAWNAETGEPLDIKQFEELHKKAMILFDKSDHVNVHNLIQRK